MHLAILEFGNWEWKPMMHFYALFHLIPFCNVLWNFKSLNFLPNQWYSTIDVEEYQRKTILFYFRRQISWFQQWTTVLGGINQSAVNCVSHKKGLVIKTFWSSTGQKCVIDLVSVLWSKLNHMHKNILEIFKHVYQNSSNNFHSFNFSNTFSQLIDYE